MLHYGFSMVFVISLQTFIRCCWTLDVDCLESGPGVCWRVRYAVPYDCSLFYECQLNCTAVVLQCQPPLHFNPFTTVCDRPENVMCTPTTTATTVASTEPATTSTSATTTTVTTTATTTTTVTTTEEVLTTMEAEHVRGAVLSVARRESVSDDEDLPVKYDVTLVDNLQLWDPEQRHVTPRRTCSYFLSLTSGGHEVINSSVRDALLPNDTYVSIVLRAPVQNLLGVSGASAVMNLEYGRSLVSVFPPDARPRSDGSLLLSLTLVDLEAAFQSEGSCAFSLTSDTTDADEGYVNFDAQRSMSFYGSCVEFADYATFVAPQDGVYFLSAVAESSSELWMEWRVGDVGRAEMWRAATNVDGTLSRALLLPMTSGAAFRLRVRSGRGSSIRLSGFRYAPLDGVLSAWTLQLTRYVVVVNGLQNLAWDHVEYDDGHSTDSTRTTVTIAADGCYFVQVDAATFPNQPLDVRVNVNGVATIKLLRRWSTPVTDGLSRGLLLPLRRGDRLHVSVASGSGVYSDHGKQTSWSGFYVAGSTHCTPEPEV